MQYNTGLHNILSGLAPVYLADDCLAICTIAGKRHHSMVCWYQVTVNTKNKNHARDEEIHGRRSKSSGIIYQLPSDLQLSPLRRSLDI